jgi:hypothetical protein
MKPTDLKTLMQAYVSQLNQFSGFGLDNASAEELDDLYNKLTMFTSSSYDYTQVTNDLESLEESPLYKKVSKLRSHLIVHKLVAEIDLCTAIMNKLIDDASYKITKSDASKLEAAAKATNFNL